MSDVQHVRRVDLISGTIVAVAGSFWLWRSADYDYLGEGGRIAAGTLPALAGLVMAVCGVAIVATATLRKQPTEVDDDSAIGVPMNLLGDEDQPAAAPADAGDLRPLMLLGSVIVCLLAVPWIGFAIAFGLLTFFIVRVFERQSLLAATSTAAFVWATSYLLFQKLFQIPLP